jgi:FKBP-type peptidyl-prolyl cis-trans isomerase FkpA
VTVSNAPIRALFSATTAFAATALARAVVASTFAMAVAMPAAHASTPKKETLPSGVVVEHLKDGSGAAPKATDTISVHYKGTLEGGSEFDSSYKRGQPASFPLNRVIPCWTEGMQKVKVGGKARLTCPGATAYGARGVPGVIPPNATLTFEVEVLSIQ